MRSGAADMQGWMGTFVSSVKSVTRTSEKMCGVFWPIDVYTEIEGAPPPKDQITTHSHNRQLIKGVMRSFAKYGHPDGCFKVGEVASEGVVQQTNLEHENIAARGRQQVDETYRAAATAASLT
eukprot:5741478-Pyramimonas_sp.AAC.2